MRRTIIIAGIAAAAFTLGTHTHQYGDAQTLNAGIAIDYAGHWNEDASQLSACRVIGYEWRGTPGPFAGEC